MFLSSNRSFVSLRGKGFLNYPLFLNFAYISDDFLLQQKLYVKGPFIWKIVWVQKKFKW